MRRIVINAYQAGLVFKNGVYRRVLKEGKHWISINETIEIFDRRAAFKPGLDLTILLQDRNLVSELDIVDVKNNHLTLRFENGLLKEVLEPGLYAWWKGLINQTFIDADTSGIEIPENIPRNILQNKLLDPYITLNQIEAHEKAVLFVNCEVVRILDSGLYYWWKNDSFIQVSRIDTRVVTMEINGQEILTKDKAALRINAWAQYQIVDIQKAVFLHKDFERQLYVSIQLALREYIASMNFDELMEKKDTLEPFILQRVESGVEKMGIVVSRLGIRDIILPGDVKEIMNQVLVAEKKAQATIIMRREETASTRSLLNTARLMEDNPMLFRLKEMEYVEKIAEKIDHISVSGNGMLVDQLRQLFSPPK